MQTAAHTTRSQQQQEQGVCVRCWEVSRKAVFKLRCALLGESRVCKSSAHVCAIGRIPSLLLLHAKVHQWEDYKNLI